MNTKADFHAFGKTTNQPASVESKVVDGTRMLEVTIGDMFLRVPASEVEQVLTMGEVKRLLKELKRIETDNQLFMAENRLLMRQIEAYEMKEEEKLKDLREGNRSPYRRTT